MFNHPWSVFEIQYLNLSLIGINADASMIICIPFIDHPTTIAKLQLLTSSRNKFESAKDELIGKQELGKLVV